MIELVGVHGTNHTHLIRNIVKVRNSIGKPCSALAMLSKGAGCPHELWLSLREGEFLSFDEFIWAVLTAAFHQLWFVVKEVQMRWGTSTVNVDHSLGRWFKMGLAGCPW